MDVAGLRFPDLDAGALPTNGVLIVEYINTDGELMMRLSNTDMPKWQVAGLLMAALDSSRDELRDMWSDVDD